MTRYLCIAPALAALAACGSDPQVDATNASVEDVAEQVREASNSDLFIQPGRWVSTVRFESIKAPGMPAGAEAQMKKMMGEGRSVESCLTEEEAQRPREGFFAGAQSDQCRYDHFTMKDGRIDARMRCSRDGVAQVMDMTGSYSPTRYEMRMKTSLEGAPEPASGMTMQMRIEAQRTGECSAEQTTSGDGAATTNGTTAAGPAN